MAAVVQRQVVSFLFCDQVGSTALLEQLGEEGSNELRRDLFAALRRPIEAFGGVEVKSQGDGLMVAFASGPSDAVACSIALQRAAARLAARDEGVPVAIRVGVATGEATGEEGDWFGRPVVEAARLCAAARPGQVLATATVAALVERELAGRATPVGALVLKGFTDGVPSVAFDWSEDAPGSGFAAGAVAVPPMLDPTGLLPFVGRSEIGVELLSAWEAATAGRPAVVTVSGPAGGGKTRLVAELARVVTRERGGIALAGSARAEPLADALRWWARASPPDLVRSTLGSLMAAVAARIPAIALQLSVGSTAVPRPDAPSGTERLDPVVAALAQVAATSPVLLLIDDAEALGSGAADDLASLVEMAPPGLLLVVAHREPSAGAPLAAVLAKIDGLPHATAVALTPWTAAETRTALVTVIPGLDRRGIGEAARGVGRESGSSDGAGGGRSLRPVARRGRPQRSAVQGSRALRTRRRRGLLRPRRRCRPAARPAGEQPVADRDRAVGGGQVLARAGGVAPGAGPGGPARERSVAHHGRGGRS